MKKVTIIVPIYNVEKYLDKCINSIINQTYKNLEIILVNDGSTDKSGEIANKFAGKDNRIKVIHQKNAGVSSARNAGIDAATGEYLCFVDSDDYVMTDYVEYLFELIKQNGADISLTTEMYSILRKAQTQDDIKIYTPEDATSEILYSNIPIGCYCKLFRRDFLNEHKLRFLPKYLMGEGFNFNTSAFQRANKVVVGRRKIYHYRLDNVDSVTTKFNMEKWLNGLEALQNIKKNLIFKTQRIETAWRFAWWLTNYDVLRLMIGANEQKLHKSEYDQCMRVVKEDAPTLSTVSGARGRKIHVFLIKINPVVAAWIFNYRRNRAMKKALPIDGAIVCITTNNNYGNVIQRYALQRFLHNNGYNFVSYYFYGYYLRQYLLRQSPFFAPLRFFAFSIAGKRRYLRKSSSIYNYHRVSRFCRKRIRQELFIPFFLKKYKTYIVGSDQVFNYRVISEEFVTSWKNFFLSFVKWDAKKVMYAPSFGNEKLTHKDRPIISQENIKRVQRFNAVSARERSGAHIMKEFWDIDAKEVLDPTLLLPSDQYDELINHSLYALHEVKPVFYYILRDDAYGTMVELAEQVACELGVGADGVAAYGKQALPGVEQWLKGFAEAEFVVTDSYHGAIFSIINHKDFVVLCFTKFKNGGGSVRYRNLLDKLGLEDRVIDEVSFNSFSASKLKPIDWRSVERKLNSLRDDSAAWLLAQLEVKDGKH